MAFATLVEEYRGNQLENIHQGIVCVIDQHKQIVYKKGDVTQSVFYRSALKPIQAIPAFLTGVAEKYNLNDQEAALMMASQRGETYQQEALETFMKKLNVTEEQLVCSASYPLNEKPKNEYIWNHKQPRKLFHNCAGKHLGFLAYAKEKGYDSQNYGDYAHPLQKDLRATLANMCDLDESDINAGVDGCGVPNYSVPLKNMAISYLKFGMPQLCEEGKLQKAVTQIGDLMQASPEIIASHDFICTELLRDPNIIAKGGAQGVYCLTLKKEKLGIALKVLSGSELVWPVLVAELLEKLEYDNQETIDRLLRLRSHDIKNDGGKIVGHTKVLL